MFVVLASWTEAPLGWGGEPPPPTGALKGGGAKRVTKSKSLDGPSSSPDSKLGSD